MGGWGEANCDRGLPVSESHGERSPGSPYCSSSGRSPSQVRGGTREHTAEKAMLATV